MPLTLLTYWRFRTTKDDTKTLRHATPPLLRDLIIGRKFTHARILQFRLFLLTAATKKADKGGSRGFLARYSHHLAPSHSLSLLVPTLPCIGRRSRIGTKPPNESRETPPRQRGHPLHQVDAVFSLEIRLQQSPIADYVEGSCVGGSAKGSASFTLVTSPGHARNASTIRSPISVAPILLTSRISRKFSAPKIASPIF